MLRSWSIELIFPTERLRASGMSQHRSGGMRRMHIYTSRGYEHENRNYPVLYLLHGGADTDDSWPTVCRARRNS